MHDLPSFDTPSLAAAVEALEVADIDELPFGAIRISENGLVAFYSKAEAKLSGRNDRPALGANFFVDIAPCFDNPDFLGRIERARKQGTIDIEFGYIGDFDDLEKEVRVRVQSASDGGYWIFNYRY